VARKHVGPCSRRESEGARGDTGGRKFHTLGFGTPGDVEENKALWRKKGKIESGLAGRGLAIVRDRKPRSRMD